VRCLQRIATLTGGEDFGVLTTLGITLSGMGRHPEAIEVLKDVAARRRNVGSAYVDLGLAQMAAGNTEDALATIKKALSLDARSAQAHCALGLCQQKLGRLREAADAFAASEQLAPDIIDGPLNLGLTLEALQDLTGARRALLRASALDPNDPDIQSALARLFGAGAGEGHASSQSTAEVAAPGVAIAGNLSTTSFLDLLEFLRLQGRTGTLALSGSRGAGELRFYQGQISSAATSNTKRFDLALIEAKVISKSNLESFISRTGLRDRESVESLGTRLIRDGVVEPRPIAQILSRRIHAALTEISSWPEGPFSFHASDASGEPAIFFNLQDVIAQLLRASSDRKQGGQRPAR